MRKTLIFLLLLSTKLTFAQLNDSFTDGNFTVNPSWGGTTSSFQIVDGVLQSNGPQSSSILYLSTANTLSHNVSWEFLVNLSFDPSTANYPRIYLIANQADLSSTIGMQGYYLQLGSSSSAENFALIRQTGATSTSILALPDRPRSSAGAVNVRVRVERTANGRWDIYTDFMGDRKFTHDGFVVDNTYLNTTFFGVYCRYSTASRATMFKFDDFKIESYIDNAAPQIRAVQSHSDNAFDVTFNETVDQNSAVLKTNYSIAGVGIPSAIDILSATSVRLYYTSAVASGSYTLSVINVQDSKGNAISTAQTATFLHIKAYVAKRGDVVINEIMAAPISTAAVLNKEYIELWNSSDQYIIITGWKYKDATSSGVSLPADTLAPKAYRILTALADVDSYKGFGKTIGLSPWPTLNNDKDELTLLLADGITVIDAVSYSDTWYKDSAKKTGYALELINPNSPCGGAFNWTASSGTNNGTPGTRNSAFNAAHTDNVVPKLVAVTIIAPDKVQVDFNKTINLAQLTNANNYSVNNGIGSPSLVEVNGVNESSVVLTLQKLILVNVESLLTVTNLTNCAGLAIDPTANTAVILMTPEIKPNDVLISEILFNPNAGGSDYVELYNVTDKTLNLKDLSISNSAAAGSASSKRIITPHSAFIRPKSFWVLSADPESVKQYYDVKNPTQMLTVFSMPGFSNDKGTVTIWRGDEMIDEVSYTEKNHHSLLKEVKGVALERISFSKSGNDIGNLQSAAESAGFGTPTYQNSQFEDANDNNAITLINKTFSPDSDGFEDLLQLEYKFKENGNLVTIDIYTDNGTLVRKLARNTTFSTHGTIYWDGLSDSSQLCTVGIYIIKVNIFTVTGGKDSFTKTCVLAGKLN